MLVQAHYLALGVGWLAVWAVALSSNPAKPNIIVIMTDDQDRLLGSTAFQPVLQREMFGKGVEFVNHHATVAQCCPSRTAFLRGQHAHNTNVTHVRAPGSVGETPNKGKAATDTMFAGETTTSSASPN